MAQSVLAEWHPEPLDFEGDAKKLRELQKAIQHEWDTLEDDAVQQLGAIVKWIPLTLALLRTTTKYPAADLVTLAETLLRIVLHAELNVPVMVRTSKLLSKVLQRLRHVKGVALEVPWRPLRALLRRQLLARTQTYESPMMLQQVVGEALTKLIRKLRRYFPSGSASEIWADCEPKIRNPLCPTVYQALGELTLFMPTAAAAKGDGDWGAWAPAWLDAWSLIAHCDFWDRHWMALFSRLAKHDTRSLVDWAPLMPQLYTRIMWAFHLPVGSATASPPISRKGPDAALAPFVGLSPSVATSAGQVIVYLLGRATATAAPGAAPISGGGAQRQDGAAQPMEAGQQDAAEGEDMALAHLRIVAALLEQYFHPSNNGSWNPALTTFLNQLSGHLARRTCREAELAAKSAADAADAAEADVDDAAAAAGGDAAMEDASTVDLAAAPADEVASDDSGTATEEDAMRPVLEPGVRDATAEIIVRLAGSALSSKDGTTVTTACFTMRRMAHLVPHTVLPLVCKRFEAALEAVTASQQLVPAIFALAMVTRPLLAVGLPPPEGEGMDLDVDVDNDAAKAEAQERAGQLVAGAMRALLPAVDANDEAKTLAVLRFFCVVLSSVPRLEEEGSGEPCTLPLAAEEWADELLSRVFAVLGNLDAPAEHRGADAGSGSSPFRGHSFLMSSEQSMFRPMVQLLFARMAPGMRRRAMTRLARFVTGSTLPSVLTEVGMMVNAAVIADPELAAKLVTEPLLAALEAELASLKDAQPSKAQEAALTFTMALLTASVMPLGAAILPLASRLRAIINAAFAVPLRAVSGYAGRLLCASMQAAVAWYPMQQFAATAQPGQLERFYDKREAAEQLPPPAWHKPSPEELEFASSLADEFLTDAAAKLSAAAADPNTAAGWLEQRQGVRALAWRLEGAVSGLRSSFVDYDHDGAAGESLAISGWAGPPLGSVDMRVAATQAVVAALRIVPEQDSETMGLLLRVAELLGQPGGQQLAEQGYLDRMWAVDQETAREPGEARLLGPDEERATRWRVRRPAWLLVERVALDTQWRDSQRAYRPWASTGRPAPGFDEVPAPVKELANELLRLSFSVYKNVRDIARNTLERLLKRYSALAPAALPPVLLAVSGALSGAAAPAGNGISGSPSNGEMAAGSSANGGSSSSGSGSSLVLSGEGVTEALLQRLLEQMHGPEVELKDDAAGEALVAGGANLMLQKALWRHCSLHADAAAASAAALVAGARLGGPRVVASISALSLYSGIRSFCAPAVRAAQAGHAPAPPATAALVRGLLAMSRPPSPARPPLHWRRSLLATAQLLLLLPPPDAEMTGQLTANLAAAAAGELSGMRALAGGGLISLLPVSLAAPQSLDPRGQAAVDAARTALGAPGWGDAVLSQLAHTHPATGGGGDSLQKRVAAMQALSQDEQSARALGLSLLRAHAWPYRSAADGQPDFLASNARLIKALALAAPAEALAAFRPWVDQALSRPQDVDRPATLAAMEALSGLLAAGAPFAGDGAAWSEWIAPLLTSAISAAPLDLIDDWSTALRLGLNGLALTPTGLQQLLDLVAGMVAPDGGSALVIKQLRCLRGCLLELAAAGLLLPAGPTSAQPSRTTADAADSSLAASADGGGSLISSLLTGGGTYDNDDPPPEANVAAASGFLAAVLGQLPALARIRTQTVQEEAAKLAVAACGIAVGSAAGGPAAAHVDELCSWTLSVLQESAGAVQVAAGTEPNAAAAGEPPTTNGQLQHADAAKVEATQHLGFALQFAIEALRFGEGPALAGRLELKLPALQRLEVPAKTALALLKYLPLPAGLAAEAAVTLRGGRAATLWTARAAALVFAQYFWFRHVFLLSPDACAKLQGMAEGMLGDPKLEVADVASATLSGMLKVAPDAAAAADRVRFLDAASVASSSRRKARRRGASSADLAAAGAGLHAAVLGLRAAAGTAPYTVPPWLPGVLSGLAAAASAPPPTGKAARAALSDFRRTHEPAALAEAREALGPQRWEAVVEFEGGREGGFA